VPAALSTQKLIALLKRAILQRFSLYWIRLISSYGDGRSTQSDDDGWRVAPQLYNAWQHLIATPN